MEQRTAQLDLDHGVIAPRAARRFLSTILGGWGVHPEVVERLQLLASELVSNAVLHGDGPIRIHVREQEHSRSVIRVEVSNKGDGVPVLRRVHRDELSGRGLQLIDDLANDWGTRFADGYTFVWFEVNPDNA